MLKIFMSIPDKVIKIRRFMKDPINILKVHSEVRKLEKERDDVLKSAEKYPEHQAELKDIFHVVDELSEELDEIIWELIDDHVNLALTRPAVLIKVLQIIYRENRLREQIISSNPSANPQRDYLTRCYERIYNNIRERILVTFKDCRKEDSLEYDTKKFINSSRDLMTLLEKVIDEVDKCFPDIIDIKKLYVETYDEVFFDLLIDISKSGNSVRKPVNDCMLMVKWIKTYYEPQFKRLGLQNTKDLMDALEMLIEEYRQYVYNSIDELSTRIIAMDRDSPPEVMDNMLYTLAPVTLFNIIQTYLSLAQNCGSTLIAFVTFDEIHKSLLNYQTKFMREIEENGKSYEIAYIVAQINNNNKCYDYADEIRQQSEALEEFKDELNFDDVLEGFQNLLKKCRHVLLVNSFRVLEEDLDKLFTKSWHEEETVEVIIATLNDYFTNEIKGKLAESYFRKFCLECLDHVIECYVKQLLKKKNATLQYNSFTKQTVDRLRTDISRLKSFFISWQVNEKFVNSHLQVLVDFAELLNADQDNIGKVLENFVKNSMDLTPNIVESVLIMRDDLDRKQVTNAMEQFKRIHEKYVVGPPPSDGIFVRLKLQKIKK